MNINERLQEIEKRKNENPHAMYGQIIYAGSGRLQFEQTDSATDDVKWMHDTIKRLQEENESLQNTCDLKQKRIENKYDLIAIKNERISELEKENEEKSKNTVMLVEQCLLKESRIEQLEKERREITAAHESFLDDLTFSCALNIKTADGRMWFDFKEMYEEQFNDIIHLAEQVRLAKLSAGVEE